MPLTPRKRLGLSVLTAALIDYLLPETGKASSGHRSATDKYTAERFLFARDPEWRKARRCWCVAAGWSPSYFERLAERLRGDVGRGSKHRLAVIDRIRRQGVRIGNKLSDQKICNP